MVIEDDYYLADEATSALAQAGAQVLGPYADAADAVTRADRHKPDCALVDVNLGRGPNFAPARALLARKVPVVFVTGYSAEVIPEDLAHVPCLQKPTDGRKIVAAVCSSCGRSDLKA